MFTIVINSNGNFQLVDLDTNVLLNIEFPTEIEAEEYV